MKAKDLDGIEELSGHVCLIALVEKGSLYRKQVGGVCCYQAQVKGHLYDLGKSDSEIFNPNWWATLCHYKDRSVTPLSNTKMMGRVKNRKKGIYSWERIESEIILESMILAHKTGVEIIDLRLTREDADMEGWLNCKITWKSGKKENAILTWPNSD